MESRVAVRRVFVLRPKRVGLMQSRAKGNRRSFAALIVRSTINLLRMTEKLVAKSKDRTQRDCAHHSVWSACIGSTEAARRAGARAAPAETNINTAIAMTNANGSKGATW